MKSLPRRSVHLFVCAVSLFAMALAQDMQPAPQGRALERVEQFKKIRLMEILNLDEQNSIKFFARYNKYREQLRDLRQKQIQTFGQIQALRKAKAADAEYAKVVSDLLAVEGQFEEVKTKYVDELKGVLSNKQLAEYLAFEYRFQQNLRELARDAQRRRQDPLQR